MKEPSRKSLRLQNKPPAPYAARSRPVQSATQQACTKQRRLQVTRETKTKHPAELQGRCPPSRFKPSEENLRKDPETEVNANQWEGAHPSEKPGEHLQLSEEDIRSLYREVMDTVKDARPLKRRSLSCSITQSYMEVDTTQTLLSSGVSNKTYRVKVFPAFKIELHAEPPAHIKAAVDRIVKAKAPDSRLAELRSIAARFRQKCITHVKSLSLEDDFISPLNYAIEALGFAAVITQAKTEWRTELKPTEFMPAVQRLETGQQQEADHASVRPPKRQRLQSEKKGPYLKTPRPDVLIGIDLRSLILDLSQNLGDDEAAEFAQWLETFAMRRGPDMPFEPALIFKASDQASLLTFPFAVVEGKAYSTGRQIFEAENQAAVSGACGLKIQLDLDSLVNNGTTRSGTPPTTSDTQPTSPKTDPPLFFSVTTQGPIHELWCHWTVVNSMGVRKFRSKFLGSYNGLSLKRAEKFIVKLNNVTNWGVGTFMKSVVERLGKIAMNTEKDWSC
ncbi:hypothetical protein GP486_001453 [Trichoglossum hirsutum]|uniref:Uncharacterized protein n=1 Tax=Trichoglossum hirsutum TaxID=265104 RepID=A0A9P8LGW1_9PEZI|nr:hypothetical protein GP486_001453 [Trichoglossum hirsutum]